NHELVVVVRLRLTLYTALDLFDRGVEVFIEYLRGQGTDWSAHPTDEEVSREYDRIWSLLGSRQIEDLVDLPVATNPDVLDLLDVFLGSSAPSMYIDATLGALHACRMATSAWSTGTATQRASRTSIWVRSLDRISETIRLDSGLPSLATIWCMSIDRLVI